MSQYVIETEGLTRYFGNKLAVDQLNLKIPKGEIFAFLGRNGSGKTTTIRMMLGLLKPSRGKSSILGCNSQKLTKEYRNRIGYMTEDHFVYRWMSIAECARYQKAGVPNWNHHVFQTVIDHFNLSPKTKTKHLSRGERAGLCLALTLAPEPELLILDDPALGLDPVARMSLIEAMLAVTRKNDRTILFSSHLINDVERVADRVAILDRSVLRVNSPMEEFRNQLRCWSLEFPMNFPDLPDIPGLVHVHQFENRLEITVANPDEKTETILNSLGASSVEPHEISLEHSVINYMSSRDRTGSLLKLAGMS
jgi:ABC-2 type transport system ATP-binding protein